MTVLTKFENRGVLVGIAAGLLMSFSSRGAELEIREAAELPVTVRPFFEIPIAGFQIHPSSTDENAETVEYRPNIQPVVGLAVGIDGLEVSVGLPMPTAEGDIEEKGKTRYFDYKGRLYRKYVSFELGLQKYRGFYQDIADPEEVRSDTVDLVYPQRRDIQKTEHYANLLLTPMGRLQYKDGDGFDFRWSPVVGVGYSLVTILGDDSFIPGTQSTTFGRDEDFRAGRFESYFLKAGGLVGIQHRRWRSHLLVIFGRGAQRSYTQYTGGSLRKWHNAGRFGFRVGGDYRIGDYGCGIFMQLDNSELKLADSLLVSEVGTIVLSLTRTFRPFESDRHNVAMF